MFRNGSACDFLENSSEDLGKYTYLELKFILKWLIKFMKVVLFIQCTLSHFNPLSIFIPFPLNDPPSCNHFVFFSYLIVSDKTPFMYPKRNATIYKHSVIPTYKLI